LKVDGYEVIEGLYYSKEHEWVKVEGNLCRIGISDYAQKSLHEIVYADLPEMGRRVKRMESMGSVESVKAVAEVFSPIAGEVVEVNRKLSEQPELINKSPYGEGWLAVIKPDSLQADLGELMDASAYADYLRQLTGK